MAKRRPQPDEEFIKQRAFSLATVYLTRRDDLVVTEATDDDAVDLHVAIKKKKGSGDRRFGVVLEGTTADYSPNQANAVLKPTMAELQLSRLSFPVCLLFFLMRTDQGLVTWVTEPIITPDGNPVLLPHKEAVCVNFDIDVLNKIVAAVNVWYDAFSKRVIDGARTHRKATGIEILHGIIDGEAAFFSQHGTPPNLLKLPVLQAYELAKLGREHLGDLAGKIIKEGVRVLEKERLLGMRVKLVADQQDYSFE